MQESERQKLGISVQIKLNFLIPYLSFIPLVTAIQNKSHNHKT